MVVYLQEILDLADWVRGAMILCPHLLDDAAREEIRVVVGPSAFDCVPNENLSTLVRDPIVDSGGLCSGECVFWKAL